MNMTLLEKVCCMLSNTYISKSFWAEELAYCCHLVNRLWSERKTWRSPGVVCGVKEKHEKITRRKIKILRSDNRGEYTSDHFLQLCRDEGIKRHFTVRETPQQNGMAERMNRTLLEKVCCMLSNTDILKSFWAEVLASACHLVNRLPLSAIKGKNPLEV